jgi:hypothetical protein
MSDDILVIPRRWRTPLTASELARLPRIIASSMPMDVVLALHVDMPVVVTGADIEVVGALRKHNSIRKLK